ncbi:Zn(II)2Cys6 transcription factor domain-containing protein [Aspergillus tubingensis]|uniref:Zn(II)2Cys6 transcription factor domain-containing protein n=1 Tax=Aspergillus tubingensis TaxID=5068 RepID=UPI001577B6B1|nr:aflatoxin biosynthesis regulatory protein [Aspergillus tubingensis]GFN12742.1 aflatoxin biosynthesis regulatory protein [Aspergillus tubingensis]
MDSQQLVSGGQPTSSEVDRSAQPYRGSCDPCRTRKVRCSGERPVCSRCASANKDCCYSSRMPLGRPRSKRKQPTCPQRPVTHPVSRENSTSPTNRVAASPESHGDIATVQPDQFTFLTQLRSGQDGGLPYCTPMTERNRIDHMPPHQLYPEPDRDLLAATVSQPSTNTCACLSEQYLLLEQLRLKSQLIVPEDLHLLRETVRKAFMILNCQHCPLRYFAIIQNSVILETKRLDSNGEHKQVRFSNVDQDGSYHANLLGHTSLFSVNLVPTEWRTIMRKVLKAEIFGSVKRAGIGTRLRLIVPLLTGRAASFPTGYQPVFD